MQKYFLFIVLAVSICDCWPNTKGSQATVELSTAETLLTTQRVPLKDIEAITEQIFRINDTTENYEEIFTVPGNIISPGSTTRISPSIIKTVSLKNLTARTRTKDPIEGPVELKHKENENDGNAPILTTGATTVLKGGFVPKRNEIENSIVRALAWFDGESSGPVQNSTGRSFLSEAATNYLNATPSSVLESMRRQGGPQTPEDNKPNKQQSGNVEAANRFSTVPTTTKIMKRTAPPRETFTEQCDYIAQYCMRVYQTGRLCGRTIYYTYQTFKSYCMLDYVNCMERYEMWQVVHMGQCYNLKTITEYIHYGYHEDYFLDRDYVADDQEFGLIG